MKIEISYLWIPILPLIFHYHLLKITSFLFILMSIHESMHVISAICLGYKIERIKVYPFGLVASIIDFEYKKSIEEIIILICGLSVHIIVAFLLLFPCSLFSSTFQEYLFQCNISIFCFNLLPIYPLDGGRILKCILEFFFPYRKAKYICLFIGIVCAILVFPNFSYLFLGIYSISFCMNFYYRRQDYKAFCLYRYLHPFYGSIKLHKKDDIYKNKENYILKDYALLNEKDYLVKWI